MKYVVLKVDDIRRYLSPEWQEAIEKVCQVVREGREAAGKTASPDYFVLNMRDQIGRLALQTYIREAGAALNGVSPEARPGIRAALKAADDLFRSASLRSDGAWPDLEEATDA